MDIKHVFGVNPLRPAYEPRSDRRAAPRELRWIAARGRPRRHRPRRRRVRLRQRVARAIRCTSAPFVLADRPVTCGDWLAFIDDGGYRRADLWLSDGWATVQRQRMGRPALLAPRRRRLARAHPPRACTPVDPDRPVVPRQPLRGRRLRPVGRRPTADRAGVGGRRRPSAPDRGRRASEVRPGRPRARPCRRRATTRWGSARCGSGPPRPTCPTRASGPPPGPSASTTGSSWSTSRSFAAVVPSPHRGTPARRYRNFFPSASRWAFSGVRLANDI